MPTLNEMIYNIRNVADAGVSSRAQNVSDRQIAFWIKYWRSWLINWDLNLRGLLDVSWEQDLGCMDLLTVDKADCAKYNWGDNVKKVVIPQLVKINQRTQMILPTLTFVGLIDKETRIPMDFGGYGSLENYVMYKNPKKGLRWKLIGNTIYLIGIKENTDIIDDDELCAINVRGIFDDVTDSCGGAIKPCFDWDKDCYPIPSHLEAMLYGKIWERELGLVAQTKQDVKNNDRAEVPL